VRIDRLEVSAYKNLRDFAIDFDDAQPTTVLIGENGSGKSNLFEAIVRIFRSLDFGEDPPFRYTIRYRCRGLTVHLATDPSKSGGDRYTIKITREDGGADEVSWSRFFEARDRYLPAYVFAYYSGPGERLRRLFDRHLREWYEALLRGDQPDRHIRRLFYCLPEHSRLVLLAYFIQGDFDRRFLRDVFGIDDFDSAMLVLRQPGWARRENRDERFWGALGLVRSFLDRLGDVALAPLRMEMDHTPDFGRQKNRESRLHLYLPDVETLRRVGAGWSTPLQLFSALESVYTNDLLRDVQIRIRSGRTSISFAELSEGEQQLLTVVGLLRFTQTEESLFLLDEPDTHLNPRWKLRYLTLLREQAGALSNSHLIISTHDPLTIADLTSGQVCIFSRGAQDRRVTVQRPSEDPRGLGVTGVLTELFGLPTTLDPTTQEKLDERERLASRLDSLTGEELARLQALSRELRRMGFAGERRDPIEARFLTELRRWQREDARSFPQIPVAEQRTIARTILARISAERGLK
jgi:predicted ATPase